MAPCRESTAEKSIRSRQEELTLFSVVIPLYNKAHTVAETLASVLAQSFMDFEVIVVDDGSTDGGAMLVERTFKDARIRLVRQEHQGASVARNRGVEMASNELIAFLDADDLFFPKYLETIGEMAESFPHSGMYCCAGFILYPDGSGYSRTSARYKGKIQPVKYFANPHFFGNASSIVVRKSHFLRCGGFPPDMVFCEDVVLFSKLGLQTPVIFCPVPLTVYRKGIPGQTTGGEGYGPEVVIDRANRIFAFWSSLDSRDRNDSSIELATFELRLTLHGFIADGTYSRIDDLFASLDPGLLQYFTAAERSAAKGARHRRLAVLYFNFLKAKRRLTFPPNAKFSEQLPAFPGN